MKTLILVLSLFLITTSCDNGGSTISDESGVNNCREESSYISDLYKKCGQEIEFDVFCKIYENDGATGSYESYLNCTNNLDNLSCDDLAEIETVNDIDSSLGCFDFPKKTKKDACVENYKNYCSSSFYECGETALTGICDDAKNIYGSSESREIDFDKSKLEAFCKTTVNGSTEIEMSDLFNETCSRYRDNLECNSVPEFDLRNDDWKTQCIQD